VISISGNVSAPGLNWNLSTNNNLKDCNVKSVIETRHFLTDEPSCKNKGIFSGETPLASTTGVSGTSGDGTIDDGLEPTINIFLAGLRGGGVLSSSSGRGSVMGRFSGLFRRGEIALPRVGDLLASGE